MIFSCCRIQVGLFLATLWLTGWLFLQVGPNPLVQGQEILPSPLATPIPQGTPTPTPSSSDTGIPVEMMPDPPEWRTHPDPLLVFSRSLGQIQQLGNIHYATIFLDGRPVIQVAAPIPDPDMASDILPIEIRVERIQNVLYQVVQTGLSPEQIEIVPGILNSQTVLLANETLENKTEGQQQFLLTVTDLDAQLARLNIPQLASLWQEQITNALALAWQERQPSHIRAQAIRVGQITLVALMVSLSLNLIQKHLRKRWFSLMGIEMEPGPTPHRTTDLQACARTDSDLSPAPGECDDAFRAKTANLLRSQPFLAEFSLKHPAVNVLLQRLLVWGQILLWFGTTVWILRLFPQTRHWGNDLLGIPIRILGIWLLLSLLNRIVDILIDQGVKAWVEVHTIRSRGSQRYLQRAPTLATALKGMMDVLVLPVGILWVLYEVQVPITPALTGAGVVGLIVSFSAQNLIKDLVNGFLILFEDQYALGDWVQIDGELGLVEYLNIRITKIRTPSGGLITIPNGTISKVENLSSDWARVNFEIDIAYECDADKAMEIMTQVAEQMYEDPVWRSRILEPPQVLGIDRIAPHGVQIRLWIKTQRLEHWGVSREYSRRLKIALQEQAISIGIPQEVITVKGLTPALDPR